MKYEQEPHEAISQEKYFDSKGSADLMDLQADKTHHVRNIAVTTAAVVGLAGEQLWNLKYGGGLLSDGERLAGDGAIVLSYLCYILNEARLKQQIKKSQREHFLDEELGSSAGIAVYSGKIPLELGEVTLSQGDRHLMVALPDITSDNKHLSAKRKQVLSSLQRMTLRQMVDEADERDIQYDSLSVVIPNSWYGTSGMPLERLHQEVSAKGILRGKEAEVRPDAPEIVVVSKDQAEAIIDDGSSVFQRACELIDDRFLSELLDLYMTSSNEIEQENIQRDISHQLRRIMLQEMEIHADGPVRQRFEDEVTNEIVTRKVYPSMRVLNQAGNLHLQKASKGVIESTPMRKMFPEIEDIDEIEQSDFQLRRAHLAHLAYTLLQEQALSELTAPVISNIEELKEELEKEGIHIREVDCLQSIIDLKRTSRKIYRAVHKSIAPLLLTALTAVTLKFGADEGIKHVPPELAATVQQLDIQPEKFPVRFSGLPKRGIDWNVTSISDMDTDGYYTLYTSSAMDSRGEWEIMDQSSIVREGDSLKAVDLGGEENISLSKDLGFPLDIGPSIILKREIDVKDLKDRIVKIPIKDGTTLVSWQVEDESGRIVGSEAYLQPDLTETLFILGDAQGSQVRQRFTIRVQLMPISKEFEHELSVKPTSDGKQKIDVKKLAPELQDEIHLIRGSSGGDVESMEQIVANFIKDRHEYSVDTSQDKALENASTPEQVLNAINSLKVCDCEVCATEAVLLTQAILTEMNAPSHVGLGIGYLHDIGNDPSSTSSNSVGLTQETMHAYEINQNGGIIDATPSKISNDRVTQEYLKMLESQQNDSQSTENSTLSSEKNQVPAEKYIELIAALLVITAGVTLSKPGYEKLSEIISKDNARHFTDSLVLSQYSYEELESAYNFFSYASFAGINSKYPLKSNMKEKYATKEDLLQAMRSNIPTEALHEIFKAPHTMEQSNPNSQRTKLKIRGLAKYLYLV